MQTVLCLILCGSIGLAALITKKSHLHGSKLAGMQYVDHVGVTLPSGWIVLERGPKPVLFVAVEPDTQDKQGRRLTVERRVVDPSLSSEEFLETSGLLKGTIRAIPAADPRANLPQSIEIAGLQGAMVMVERPISEDSREMETQLFAASVRPSGLAISLRLDCPDDSDPAKDLDVLRYIAKEMEVQDSVPGK